MEKIKKLKLLHFRKRENINILFRFSFLEIENNQFLINLLRTMTDIVLGNLIPGKIYKQKKP